MTDRHFILGGARSGKSRRAQSVAEGLARRRVFIATAQAFDEEMAERIARHRADRAHGWETIETPLDPAGAVRASAASGTACLVDCLTLWLSNLMHAGRDVDAATLDLVRALDEAGGPVVLVSNEIGLGLVPETPLGRRFRDAQGRLNQAVAAACDRVEFVAAGLPLVLKG
ncbi:MAG: bifunctional adenosylcobinamide kinase/adenosylcobinamide-phosphate guanylyltransferase [Pseudomonadota bacterium]